MKGSTKTKDLFTTGEAAEICRVSRCTIIRCFDSGRLEGFRVPGSKFRRIPRESLIKFMKANNISLKLLDSGKMNVLIVDDDLEIVERLERILSRDGRFETITASCVFEAGIVTEKFRPDLVLLDYTLPDVNAMSICKTIRKYPELEGTAVIIVSGMVEHDKINQLLKSGAGDFIKKPFSEAELMQKVNGVLERG